MCVLTYAVIYVLIHQIIFRFYLLKYSLFFSNTLVLTSSIDVVFILSIGEAGILAPYHPIQVASTWEIDARRINKNLLAFDQMSYNG